MGSKWIFTVKYKYDGSLDKYKVRLVTKGYSQTYCIDYHVTLALAAKMNTIDILLSLVGVKDWSLHQVDVKNVFLHRDLEEEVYMDIPPRCGTEYKMPSLIPAKSFWPYLNSIISLSLSHSGHQSLFSEPREKTLSSQSNSRQKTLTAGNFSGELSGELSGDGFFLHRKERLEEISICPKASEPETHPRAAHARFSGRRLHLTRRRVRAREPLFRRRASSSRLA
ncbi:Retrovirus-related Pol polyprotein from transposon RE1 [Vitis vinifera]|uniref:Retrovirus-related Pol polyprotein from transposon RE1 n=1 Tax=Vitis vinifera TaxID=29760 RepID=A0A438F9Z4_VITVI|nr:Retrovirus-related Pol polyprotein from transposon RE1 [Vitis vinifera]